MVVVGDGPSTGSGQAPVPSRMTPCSRPRTTTGGCPSIVIQPLYKGYAKGHLGENSRVNSTGYDSIPVSVIPQDVSRVSHGCLIDEPFSPSPLAGEGWGEGEVGTTPRGCPSGRFHGSFGTAPFGFAPFDYAQDRQGRLRPSPAMIMRCRVTREPAYERSCLEMFRSSNQR